MCVLKDCVSQELNLLVLSHYRPVSIVVTNSSDVIWFSADFVGDIIYIIKCREVVKEAEAHYVILSACYLDKSASFNSTDSGKSHPSSTQTGIKDCYNTSNTFDSMVCLYHSTHLQNHTDVFHICFSLLIIDNFPNLPLLLRLIIIGFI